MPFFIFFNVSLVLKSQDTVGSGAQSQVSPQSSPEVNVTCVIQPDIVDDQVISTPPMLSNSVEEEVDIPEPDEAEVTARSGSALLLVMFLLCFGLCLDFFCSWCVCVCGCVCVHLFTLSDEH